MIVLRSVVFNFLFFLTMMIMLAGCSPLVFFDRKYAFRFWKILSIIIDFLSRRVAGIEYVIENPERLSDTRAIYAMRHESTWETLVMIHKFHRPIFVLKKELLQIPFFGLLARKAGSICVDRDNGAASLKEALKKVALAVADGHPVIIFPEGTRMPTGEYVQLKRGIALFYKKSAVPIVPIIHNSGKFWPRRGFIKNPGCVRVKCFEPIPPGLSQDEFMERLNELFYSEIEKIASSSMNDSAA